MTPTRPTADEITAHERAAGQFFARPRSPKELRELDEERYVPALRTAAAEAKTAPTSREIETAKATRREQFRRAQNSPLLDGVSRNLLRRTRGIRQQSAVQLERNQRAADRFFRAVDGRDLSAEITGHTRWKLRRRLAAAVEVWRLVRNAPIDPLTEDEARLVGTKLPKAQWLSWLREVREATTLAGEVRPVGMTLERALEIAQQVEDAQT